MAGRQQTVGVRITCGSVRPQCRRAASNVGLYLLSTSALVRQGLRSCLSYMQRALCLEGNEMNGRKVFRSS